jgi:hypothetical protein
VLVSSSARRLFQATCQHFSLRVRESWLTCRQGGAAAVLTSEGVSLSVLTSACWGRTFPNTL